MSLLAQLALVSEGSHISTSDLTRVASALSKQVQNDFGPIWNIKATVDGFVKLEDVPTDYWPIIVMTGVKDAEGYHEDQNGQPFSLVEFDGQWPLTASHECLEMLADPFGRRLKSGYVPDQAVALGEPRKRVRFLIEVCDPAEAADFSYQISGVQVSDFYTPNYFDPVKAPTVRYSFTGAIDAPRKVLKDGYISWQDPQSKHWMQLRMFADEFSNGIPHVLDLTDKTVFNELRSSHSLRSAIDRLTRTPRYNEKVSEASLTAAKTSHDTSMQAQEGRAQDLREAIQDLLKGHE